MSEQQREAIRIAYTVIRYDCGLMSRRPTQKRCEALGKWLARIDDLSRPAEWWIGIAANAAEIVNNDLDAEHRQR